MGLFWPSWCERERDDGWTQGGIERECEKNKRCVHDNDNGGTMTGVRRKWVTERNMRKWYRERDREQDRLRQTGSDWRTGKKNRKWTRERGNGDAIRKKEVCVRMCVHACVPFHACMHARLTLDISPSWPSSLHTHWYVSELNTLDVPKERGNEYEERMWR